VHTKRGWAIEDYNNEHGARNFLLILLYPLILLSIVTLINVHIPYEWMVDLLCFGGIISWVSLVVYFQIIAPGMYASRIEEEE
jgi:hypothetical protein